MSYVTSLRTALDVLPVNVDVVVPFSCTLLMIKTGGVQELVDDGVVPDTTIGLEVQFLRPPEPSHPRPTSRIFRLENTNSVLIINNTGSINRGVDRDHTEIVSQI